MRPYGVRDTGGGVLGYTDTGTGTPALKTVVSNLPTRSTPTKTTPAHNRGYDTGGGVRAYTDAGTGTPTYAVTQNVNTPWCQWENSSSFIGLSFTNNTALRRLGWCGVNTVVVAADFGFMYGSAFATVAELAGAPATMGASCTAAAVTLSLFVESGVHLATDGASLTMAVGATICNNDFNSQIGFEKDRMSAIFQIFILGVVSTN